MSTPVITPPPVEPSMSDIRAMLSASASPAVAKPETPEPAAPVEKTEEATKTETAPEPVETKKVSEEESTEDALPEGVKKRIAKEVAKAAGIQAEIDRAVSDRKAKEAQLAKLKTDASGSEPVKPPQASAEKPKRPVFGEAGYESENWDQFEARQVAHEDKISEWTRKTAIEEFRASQAQENAQKQQKERWDAAITKHGTEFPELMAAACAVAPEGLQLAISALDNWSDVAVHLANDPAKLKSLAAEFQANQYKAIATLGRIEAALTPTETKNPTQGKPLPEPLAKVGGNASASGMSIQDQLEKGSWAQVRAIATKARGKP